MYSIDITNMCSSARVNLVQDKEATKQNLALVLLSAKKTLLGDPYFGSNLEKLIYENNNPILADLVIDAVEEVIVNFMPQLRVNRKDIKVYGTKQDIIVEMEAINILNGTSDLYSISLMNTNDF